MGKKKDIKAVIIHLEELKKEVNASTTGGKIMAFILSIWLLMAYKFKDEL